MLEFVSQIHDTTTICNQKAIQSPTFSVLSIKQPTFLHETVAMALHFYYLVKLKISLVMWCAKHKKWRINGSNSYHFL